MDSVLHLSKKLTWRRIGHFAAAHFISFIFFFFALHRHDVFRDHRLVADDEMSSDSTQINTFSPSEDWKSTCSQHGFSVFAQPRKVYDLVLFSTELDWLEIRLHTHPPYVDYIVIIESPTTFTHLPKPLRLKESWDRFKEFHNKIIYRVIEDPIVSTRHWDHEDYLRNALLHGVFPSLVGEPQEAQEHDVLLVSDMDELLKPNAILLMRHCHFPQRLTLRTHFYYYSFQWLHRGEQWAHPQATTFQGSIDNTLAPNDLRQNLVGPGLLPVAALSRWWNQATLWNAGWHCSSCFSTIKETQTKMHSFSHQLWNTEQNREAKTMVERVRNGLDLFGRPEELYDKVLDNKDVPRYILDEYQRGDRFGYLLNRDGVDAGFKDWKPPLAG